MRALVVFILVWSISSTAQKKEDQAIMEPIQNLFLAMEKGDSALLHTAFFTDVTLITILEKDGKFKLRKEGLASFLNAVGSPHKETWFEPIWNVKVQQEDNFAQVWADYAFYAGNKFSHCGVDTFQLVKTEKGWKIFYLADTRKKIGCDVPKKIDSKYSNPN
jgi:anaerobic glycerol-3-phosphate dehydrogenase